MPLELWIDFVLAWFILFPAYAANATPVLARGKRPLDFGKKWRGARILGDGKTVEGTVLGIIAGFLVGALEYYLLPSLQAFAADVTLPQITLLVAFAIPLGVMIGDIIGSFAKRRMGIRRGDEAPLMDQLGFIVVAILFAYPFVNITPGMAVFMLLATFAIHKAANFLAYKLRLKNVPW